MDVTMQNLQPGNYIVVQGGGLVGKLIRYAETEMYKDEHPTGWKAWAGHAGIYLGGGKVLGGTFPRARVDLLSYYQTGRANTAEPLTEDQRKTIVTRALQLLRVRYDIWAYPALVGAMLHVAKTKELDELYTNDRWRDCSAIVADSYDKADIGLLDIKVPNLVTPEFLHQRIITQNWGH